MIDQFNTEYRPAAELIPHPDNPRGDIDPDAPEIGQLAEDIKRRGLIQPLVITPDGKILAGHRRRLACIKVGLELVPVVIRELQKHEFAEEFFLSENMQRQDLSPLEEARAIAAVRSKLEKQWKTTVNLKDLARRLDLPSNTVSLRLQLLELPERVQKLFHLGEIPINSSRMLAKLKDFPDEIEKIADKMVTRKITLRSLDTIVNRRLEEMNRVRDDQKRLAREPRMEKIKRSYPENHHTPSITRQSVMDTLSKSTRGRISLFNVKLVLDSTCCSCGMMGSESVCLSCPLPRFVNGLIGRADVAGGVDA